MMRYDTTPSPAPWGCDGTQDAPADPKRVAQEMAKLATPAPAYNPYTDWIRRGLARIASGQPVSEGVRKCIEDAARIKGIKGVEA